MGEDLAYLVPFLEKLMLAQPLLLFKYVELRQVFEKLAATYPCLKESFPPAERSGMAAKLAERTMTVACHARRLRDPMKFQECCRSLTEWQVEKLQTLKAELDRLQEDCEADTVQLEGRATSSKLSCRGRQVSSSSLGTQAKSVKKADLKEILDMELPATQDSDVESLTDDLLKKAERTSPVPARKRTLLLGLKKDAGKALKTKGQVQKKKTKRPVKAMKKKAKQENKNKNKEALTRVDLKKMILMPYKKTGAVAVRIKGGKQLFQVSCHKDLKKNQKLANEFMQALLDGKSLAEVKEQRDQMHPRGKK